MAELIYKSQTSDGSVVVLVYKDSCTGYSFIVTDKTNRYPVTPRLPASFSDEQAKNAANLVIDYKFNVHKACRIAASE